MVIIASIALFVLASFQSTSYAGSIFYIDWWLRRTAYLINILLIFCSYVISKRYPHWAFFAVNQGFSLVFWFTIVGFGFYLSVVILTPNATWATANSLMYGKAEIPLTGVELPRFGGLFKEPSEAAFFLVVMAAFFAAIRRYFHACACLFIGVFTVSNTFPVLLLAWIGIRFVLSVSRKLVVPLGVVSVTTGIVLLGIIDTPSEKYFQWLGYIVPRSENLVTVRDTPQHLWVNWVGIQYFWHGGIPLGGGGSFIEVLDSKYYYFAVDTSWATGKGVVRLLTDFGIAGVAFVFLAATSLHRVICKARPTDDRLIIVMCLCVVIMLIRTGYYNISVWSVALTISSYLQAQASHKQSAEQKTFNPSC